MTRVARFVTDFADQAVLLPVAIAVAVAFAIAGWWRGAIAWTTAVGATLGVMLLFKLAVLACAPLLPGADVSPSGHTAVAGVDYGGLLAIMARYVTGQGRWMLPLAAGVTAIVGVSRLALGVHTVLDVCIGGTVGIGGAMAVAKQAGPPLPDVGPKLQAITALALPVLVGVLIQSIRGVGYWMRAADPLTRPRPELAWSAKDHETGLGMEHQLAASA